MIAFIFPGQGSQKVGMGRALAEAFPICRATFEEAADAGDPALQFDLQMALRLLRFRRLLRQG